MNTAIGLDIGSHSIKLVELDREKEGITLLSAGVAATPSRAFALSSQEDLVNMAGTIKKLIKDAGVKSSKVNIALPESKVFTRVIQMPALTDRELASAIRWEAEQYIPLPLEQVSLDYTVLGGAKPAGSMMDVLLVASPKSLIVKYVSLLEMSDLTPLVVETEILAISRALVRSVRQVKHFMIVSIGAQTTDVAILHNGALIFTRSISSGADAMARALSQSFGMEKVQAEAFMKTYGLQKDSLQGKIVDVIKPIMETILGEINRSIAYYKEHYPEDQLGAIILSGGSARLPSLVAYMAQALNIEVQLADPWAGIKRDPRFAAFEHEGPVFTVAIGLALR